VGAVMFNLRSGLKAKWIDTNLPDNTAGWRSKWFYIVDQIPSLPRRTGHKPENEDQERPSGRWMTAPQ
jgi:hypothetical protein